MKLFMSGLLLTALVGVSSAQELTGAIEFEFDSPAMFPSPDGSVTTIEPGLYEVTMTREMYLTLTNSDGDTKTISTVLGEHDLELEDREGLATIDDDGVHLVVMLPESILVEAVGTAGNIATRGSRVTRSSRLSYSSLQRLRNSMRTNSRISVDARRQRLQQQAQPQRTGQIQRVVNARPSYAVDANAPKLSYNPTPPDLTGSYDSQRNKVTIRNTGRGDAVFPNGGILGGTQSVPAGGRVKVGQEVAVSSFTGFRFDCPSSPTAATIAFPSLKIDPSNVISESNENNNEVRINQPYPARLTAKQARAWEQNPGDITVRIETTESPNGAVGGGYLLQTTVIWKNTGRNYIYACDNDRFIVMTSTIRNVATGEVVRSGPRSAVRYLRLAPGKELSTYMKSEHRTSSSQFGETADWGWLQPGCYSIEASYDTRNVVRESNKSNNTVSKKFSVRGGSCT